MKKVLLTIPLGMSARNILRTEVYRLLKAECKLIIISRLSQNKDFIDEFAAPNVSFYDMPPLNGWRAALRARLQNYWTFHYGKKTGSETARRYRERLRIKNKWGYYRASVFEWLLDRLKLWKAMSILTRNLSLHHRYYSDVLEKERPDLVMSLSPLVTEEDLLVMSVAKRRKIPVVGFVHSWDSIPKESNPWVLPDKLIVWNRIMKEQARNFLNYSETDIFVVGVPQYDEYLFNTPALAGSEYKALKDIPQDAKILTYTCGAPTFFVDEEDFIRDLIGLIDQGVFGNAVLILRLHPKYNIDKYKAVFGNLPKVFFDEADSASVASYVDVWNKENSNQSYVNLLRNSDVIINLGSTVTIDAAIFDKPVVNVAYDLQPAKGFWFSNARFYESAHYKHITASGGAKIACSRDDLINDIKMYLEDSSIDREGRKRIVDEQCYKLDGKSCERVVQAVLDVVREREK